MVTRSMSFGPSAATADTKGAVGSETGMPSGGVIKRIRVCFYQGVIDKATTGILYLETNLQKGPWEFAIGGSIGITTTSGATGPNIPTEEIECNIPVKINEKVTLSVKMAEALEEVTVSILWE